MAKWDCGFHEFLPRSHLKPAGHAELPSSNDLLWKSRVPVHHLLLRNPAVGNLGIFKVCFQRREPTVERFVRSLLQPSFVWSDVNVVSYLLSRFQACLYLHSVWDQKQQMVWNPFLNRSSCWKRRWTAACCNSPAQCSPGFHATPQSAVQPWGHWLWSNPAISFAAHSNKTLLIGKN